MKVKRKTISEEFTLEGIGLHKGKRNFLRLTPSFSSNGIRFINALTGEKIILNTESVRGVNRGTTLSNGNFEVNTVEHLLSALMAFSIDDLDIYIEGDEIPAFDGSSIAFSENLLKVCEIEKDDTVEVFEAMEELVFRSEDTYYKVEKSNCFEIECMFENDHPLIKKQMLRIEINRDNYIKEISPARTFGFDYEVEFLRKNNLALGGSLDNSIVLSSDSVLNREPLRFGDEFVRHKILDLLGDLKVLGLRFTNTKITALRPSHRLNYELVKLISARRSFYG
ncbi:MAG: UDP-3-O-[3-hydroxymyristoyl] N-acetylglucosamine deacetylase [Elusimicrobiales bacterium]|nr:UDP-3-O-[3-hydroxymyristoyl] N-acetylglucosamine deacetylase [Elusimicrobiales bacterium]